MNQRSLSFWILAAAVAWLALGLVAVPPVIEAAYAGHGPALLQQLLADYPGRPLAFFLGEWRAMVWYGAGAAAVFAGFAYLLRTPRLARRLVGKATPGALGAMRALVCAVLLASVLWEDLPSTAALPRDLPGFMGVMALFRLVPGFEAFAASPAALGAFQWATAAALFLGMVGWRTRWTLPLAAVAYLLLGGLLRQYAWFYHTGLLPLYLLAVLCFLPAGDGGSVDRLRRLWKGERVAPAKRATRGYGWARYAVWAALAIPYVMAGLSKLRNSGLEWWSATNFKYILLYSTLRPMEFDFEVSLWLVSAPDSFLAVLAAFAVLGELAYGLVLFSRWARWVVPLMTLGMHVGILFLQNILFFDLIALQFLFFNLRPLRRAAARRLAARYGRLRLAYDGGAERQRRAVRVLRALDVFERFEIERFEPEDRAGAAGGGRAASWTVAAPGDAYPRQDVGRRWRAVARAVPLLWLLWPLLCVPGAAQATERFVLGRSASAPAKKPAAAARRPRRRHASWAATPRLTLAIAALLFISWTLRLEVYPLTGMQMFSKTRGPVVTYEIPVAHLRSGETIEAPIVEAVGAMADSRYRRLLQDAFEPEGEDVSRRFLHTVAARWNRQAPPERHITKITVNRWRWNYEEAPEDPDHGQIVARRVYPITAPPAQQVRGAQSN